MRTAKSTSAPQLPLAGTSLFPGVTRRGSSRRNGNRESRRARRSLLVEQLEDRRLLAVTPGANLSTGTQLTTYTLALATTGEFTQAAGGKAATLTFLQQFVSEINKIYEPELAIRFQLHPQNVNLIFENAATDGFSNGDAQKMVTENPTVINTALNGSAANDAGYDFGHALGLGHLPGFGGTATKASGASHLDQPSLEARFVEFVGHELGHQMGANHIQNGVGDNCGGNRNPPTAVEPGSGSTIMGYQGTCAGDDLLELPGDGKYFHAQSFDEIIRFTTNVAPQRGTKTSTGNNLPSINAGLDRTIPAATPFLLTANGTDPDAADRLTYTWEQIDPGTTAGVSLPIANSQDQSGPLFRSYSPSTVPVRTFPRLEELLANTPASQNKNDHLPTQNRDLNFRVTVRDNHLFNGQTVSGIRSDDVKLTVVNTGAPFQVTSFNGPNQPLAGGSLQTVSWNVAGTTANGINTAQVDIWLSVDGGRTFPLKLAAQTSNDGSETVRIPNVQAAQARIKIQADPSQNIFFDVNDSDFTITQQTSVSGGIIVAESGGNTSLAEGLFVQTGLAATDSYTIALTQPPTAPVTLTITADSQTQVSLNGTTFSNSQLLTFAAGDATPKTVTVKAIDDSTAEGIHAAVIRQAVTTSLDPNYLPEVLIGDIVNAVTVAISDDEAPPLIGVELDYGNVAPTAPSSWNRIEDPFQTRLSNLKRESGDLTPIDFAISIANPIGGGWSDRTLDTSTVPNHSPDLASVGDVMFWENSAVTVTWSDLRPNAKYRVYVISASEVIVDAPAPIKQTITIAGSGGDNPPPFLQDGTGKTTGQGAGRYLQLLINGSVGSSNNPLEQYAQVVTSSADRKITIQVNPAAGGSAAISALAIQEFLEPVPGMTVTQTNGNTEVSETGSTDSFSVVLDAAPTSDVVLSVASANSAEATADKTQLTFTPQNWNAPQLVTVTGVDDLLVDGDQTTNITVGVNVAQSDSRYATVPAQVVATITKDNDVAGFTVAETGGKTEVSEAGTTDSFTVALTVQPASNVVLTVTSANPAEATVTPLLTFTPQNWNVPQSVTVIGIDDPVADGDQAVSVSVHVIAAQSDPSYADVADKAVIVTNKDNESPGFTIAETGGKTEVAEGGPVDTISVVLNVAPLSNVVLQVATGNSSEVTAAPTTATFTPANWNQPQIVTLTGVDDQSVDGNTSTNVTVSIDASQSNSAFAGLTPQSVFVTILDNDQAGFAVAETNGNTQVSELATTDTFSVVLTKQPIANVVFNVASSSSTEATIDKGTVEFSPANWNVPQTITVTGIQDGQIDGDQAITVTVAVDAGKSQSQFGALPPQTVSITVIDSGLTRPWLNPANRLDVSGDGNVVPNDALRIINELNDPKYRNAAGQLPDDRPPNAAFYDVNGDGFVTPNDALQVINYLNSGAVAPEGESSGEASAMQVVAEPRSGSRQSNGSGEPDWVSSAGAWLALCQRFSEDSELDSILTEIAADRVARP